MNEIAIFVKSNAGISSNYTTAHSGSSKGKSNKELMCYQSCWSSKSFDEERAALATVIYSEAALKGYIKAKSDSHPHVYEVKDGCAINQKTTISATKQIKCCQPHWFPSLLPS